jgi:hypothetical protein
VAVKTGVARWFTFKRKIPIRVNFGGPLQWKMLLYFMAIWYILWPFCIFYGHLVYFMAILYILWYFGIFYGTLVYFMVLWYILWYFGICFGTLVYFVVMATLVKRKVRVAKREYLFFHKTSIEKLIA